MTSEQQNIGFALPPILTSPKKHKKNSTSLHGLSCSPLPSIMELNLLEGVSSPTRVSDDKPFLLNRRYLHKSMSIISQNPHVPPPPPPHLESSSPSRIIQAKNEETLRLFSDNTKLIADIQKESESRKRHNSEQDEDQITTIVIQDQGLIVQPKFFESQGTMCSAELWSNQLKKQFLAFTKQDVLANSKGKREFQLKKLIKVNNSSIDMNTNKLINIDLRRSQLHTLNVLPDFKQQESSSSSKRSSIASHMNKLQSRVPKNFLFFDQKKATSNSQLNMSQMSSQINLDESLSKITSTPSMNQLPATKKTLLSARATLSQSYLPVPNNKFITARREANSSMKEKDQTSSNSRILDKITLNALNSSLVFKEKPEQTSQVFISQRDMIKSAIRKNTSISIKLPKQMVQNGFKRQRNQSMVSFGSNDPSSIKKDISLNRSINLVSEFDDSTLDENDEMEQKSRFHEEGLKDGRYDDVLQGIIEDCNETLQKNVKLEKEIMNKHLSNRKDLSKKKKSYIIPHN